MWIESNLELNRHQEKFSIKLLLYLAKHLVSRLGEQNVEPALVSLLSVVGSEFGIISYLIRF